MTTLLTMKGFNKQATPITTAGIYHNPSLGLISLSSDGTNWITIADKNLGATTVYNDGDTLSEANCGKYFQWGNNYGFPFTGAVTTSSSQVNASTYGPGNYYESSTWITQTRWDSSYSTNLWGGETGTVEAMKGPCDSGYHVPNEQDATNIINILSSLNISSGIDGYLKMPLSGSIQYNGSTRQNFGIRGEYYLSTAGTNGTGKKFYIGDPTGINQLMTGYGANIRPFANTPVQPDDSWTVLYPTN